MQRLKKTYILVLLTAMFFLALSATDIYVASLPRMVRDFKTTPNIVNFTLSCYNISIAVSVLFSGVLSDRFGRRVITILGFAIFTFSSFLIVISPSIWLIIILRFAQGMGSALNVIVSRQILKDIMNEKEQVKANSIILSGLIISPAIAPVIGAFLAHHFGWRSCFLFSGITGAILTTIAIKTLPETNTAPIAKLPSLRQYVSNYFLFFCSKLFLVQTTIYASALAAFYAFIGISSYLYINELGISPIMYSHVYIFIALAYLAGNQYLLMLNRRSAPNEKIMGNGTHITMAGAFVILLAVFFTGHVTIAVLVTVGALLMRAANALINPSSQVRIINYFREKGGQALGLNMSIGFALGGCSISMVTLFHKNPLEGLIIVSMAFSLVAIIAFALSKHTLNEKD